MLCSNDCSLMSNIAVKALWYLWLVGRDLFVSVQRLQSTHAHMHKSMHVENPEIAGIFLGIWEQKETPDHSIGNVNIQLYCFLDEDPAQSTAGQHHCHRIYTAQQWQRLKKKGLKTRFLHFSNFQHYRGCSILFFCIRPIMLWGLLAHWLE